MELRSEDLRVALYRRRRQAARRLGQVKGRYRELDGQQFPVAWAWRRVTSPARTLPSFLIIGAQKAGTTALHRYLCEHPDVRPARVKELHYFSRTANVSRLDYRAHFPLLPPPLLRRLAGRPEVQTFEASPSYLFRPEVPARVGSVLGQSTRFVVLLREPVERTVSQVRMGQARGWEHLELLAALQAEDRRAERLRQGRLEEDPLLRAPRDGNWAMYRQRSLYADQLERWFGVYPRGQFLVLRSEDLKNEVQRQFDRVCEFLDLGNHELRSTRLRHVGPESGVPREVRAFLEPYFVEPNRRLQGLVGVSWDDRGEDLGYP